ncbi:uncharacterized protein [Palaemon carinicauda]|uniref:uncharacterized protein n=1 Tax=Palaemon carinicauda TaxID=392227 RepID=UPI0035B5DAF5
MQLKEHNLCENGGDINGTTDCLEKHDNFELQHVSDNVPTSIKTPKLQSTMEDTKEILELLQKATRTVEIAPKGYQSMHEVYPSLFIGDEYAALDKAKLKDSGITNVLNVAQGKGPDYVDSDDLYYSDVEIRFLGIRLMDSPRVRIYQFFRPAFTFIHEALAGGGKVLVHSKQGVSRASTMACSYLMIKQKLAVKETLLHIQRFRNVLPNRGFVSQLLELEWRRSSFMRELRNLQITVGESNGDFENKNGSKTSLETQCREKDSTNKIRNMSITGIYEQMYCEEHDINGTKESLENGTNEVEGLIDRYFCGTDGVKNSKEMPENGSYSEKELKNEKNNNSKKCQEFPSTPREVLAAIEAIPFSREMLDRVTSLEPNIDEVYPGMYIGNYHAALDKPFLKEAGITYILNTAQGEGLVFVDTEEKFYQDLDISFLGVRIPDSPHVRIVHIFTKTYAFIEECLSSGGKILIHSIQGTSRATTIACSYIMVKENWSVKDSLMSIGQVRVVSPNRGFVSQLCELEWRKKYIFKDQTCESNPNRSHDITKSGVVGAKYHTEFKVESSFKMESDKVVENITQEPIESREPHENRIDSSNDPRRKTIGVKHKDAPDSQSKATTASEILRMLKATAVESDIKRKVASTEPDIVEAYPGLYIGNQHAALDQTLLKHTGITHVLNAAHGKDSESVNTSEQYYQAVCINFFSLKLPDSPNIRIVKFFKPTFDFIRAALASGGKVLVHSKRGISRAPALACCYIMLTEHKSCIESLVSMNRITTVLPNRGFIAQLMELEWRRGSILKDSINSVGKTQVTLDLTHNCKPHLEEIREEINSKNNSQEINEISTNETQLFHENHERQINKINNLKDLQIPDVGKTENFEIAQEEMKPLDAISSIIKTTEVMCVLKDMSMGEKMSDDVIIDNQNVKCTQTCMWEINMLL